MYSIDLCYNFVPVQLLHFYILPLIMYAMREYLCYVFRISYIASIMTIKYILCRWSTILVPSLFTLCMYVGTLRVNT